MAGSYRSRSPAAQLLTRTLPDGLTAYVADCRYSTSTFVYVPGAMRLLPEGALPLIDGWMHEERCGRCDVEPVLARGDQELRAKVDRMELTMAVAERRN